MINKIEQKFGKIKSATLLNDTEEIQEESPIFRNSNCLEEFEENYFRQVDNQEVHYRDYCERMEYQNNHSFIYLVIPNFSATSIPSEANFDIENFAKNL